MKSKVSTMMRTIFLTVAVLSLLLVSVPTVSAKVLRYKHTIFLKGWDVPNPDPRHVNDPPYHNPDTDKDEWWYWTGPITDISTGKLVAWSYFSGVEGAKANQGKGWKFREDVYIVFTDSSGNLNPDSWIWGTHDGVWTYYPNSKYRTVGWITAASPDKASFIGYRWEEEGVTDGTADMGIGVGSCWLKSP